MIKINTFLSRYNFIIVPFLLLLSLVTISVSLTSISSLAPYLIIDFLFTVPLIYYFLIRKKDINKFTVITLTVIGFFLSDYLIPVQHQGMFNSIKIVAVPILEIVLFITLILKVRKFRGRFKQKAVATYDFYDALYAVCLDFFPSKISSFIATETAVFYYTFFKWKSHKMSDNEFSYHKEGTYTGVLLGILLVIVIETFVLHALLVETNVVLAWIMTGFSIYTLIQVTAILKSMRARFIAIDNENKKLHLRFSFLSNVVIDFNMIEDVKLVSGDTAQIDHLSFLGSLTGCNVVLNLKEEITYKFFYGMQRKSNKLGLIIDDKMNFINKIKAVL